MLFKREFCLKYLVRLYHNSTGPQEGPAPSGTGLSELWFGLPRAQDQGVSCGEEQRHSLHSTGNALQARLSAESNSELGGCPVLLHNGLIYTSPGCREPRCTGVGPARRPSEDCE